MAKLKAQMQNRDTNALLRTAPNSEAPDLSFEM